jgi:hypothetical protein
LNPNIASYVWEGFPAGETYYIRVNQLLWDGTWDPSKVVGFASFGCKQSNVGSQGGTTNGSNNSISSTGYAIPEVFASSGGSGALGPNANPLTYTTANVTYHTPNATYVTPNPTYSTPNPTYFTPNPVYQMGAQVGGVGANPAITTAKVAMATGPTTFKGRYRSSAQTSTASTLMAMASAASDDP